MITQTFTGRQAAVEAGTRPMVGESRKQSFKSQMRSTLSEQDGKTFATLEGYASTVSVPYEMWDFFGQYNEIIDPRAFDRTLAAKPDVAFLLNHTGMTMARTTNGTLQLSVDDVGLKSVAELNPLRQDVADLLHAVDDGNIDEMSFAFRILDGKWSPDYTEYTITEVDLNRGDVSAVNYGANPDTSISARMKQTLEGLEGLTGEPLRVAAARAAQKLAEQPQEAAGRNAATLRAMLELEGYTTH